MQRIPIISINFPLENVVSYLAKRSNVIFIDKNIEDVKINAELALNDSVFESGDEEEEHEILDTCSHVC